MRQLVSSMGIELDHPKGEHLMASHPWLTRLEVDKLKKLQSCQDTCLIELLKGGDSTL